MNQPAATITPLQQGVLVDTDLHHLFAQGHLSSQTPLVEGQVQPASLDLRLGTKAYRIQAGFLPGKGRKVSECLPDLCMTELDLTQPQLFERGAVYLVPLQESLNLPPHIEATASPKSSTGRLDIFVRLLTDHATIYDTVTAGYSGPMFVEISPLTFPIVIRAGDRLNQLRLRQGDVRVSDADLTTLHTQIPLLRQQVGKGEGAMNQGLWISIDLHGEQSNSVGDNPIIGYRAKHHTQPIDLARIGGYQWSHFWEPITRSNTKPLILYPEEFYIFASSEGICVPPSHAAELVAYDTRIGEIRVHYAGFFDPGFGFNGTPETNGTTAVLEVRAHDVPCVLEHGQPIGRFLYEKLLQTPANTYGSGIGSNYANQGLKLAKQFKMDV
ncbi:MAG: 2'-deoxycytidine 5'-triphosphate deaminase [Pseudomonas fluorescens]|nr:MAG: 2'-deoxycytidine 5'-triphosphate deaminase [Pseudomonas fluorescens]